MRPTYAKPQRVAHALERDIKTGLLAFGDRLQSETELVRRFAVSRTTVRKGLEVLAGKGLIETRMGIGSFVAFDGEVIDGAMGWTRALAGRNAEIVSELLSLAIVSDAALARELGLRSRRFLAVDRIRLIRPEGTVVSIERSRVPYQAALAAVPRNGLAGGSLAKTLTEAGMLGASGEEWAAIEYLGEADAQLMRKPAGAACLKTRRIVRDAARNVIEHVVSLLDPAHFALQLKF